MRFKKVAIVISSILILLFFGAGLVGIVASLIKYIGGWIA